MSLSGLHTPSPAACLQATLQASPAAYTCARAASLLFAHAGSLKCGSLCMPHCSAAATATSTLPPANCPCGDHVLADRWQTGSDTPPSGCPTHMQGTESAARRASQGTAAARTATATRARHAAPLGSASRAASRVGQRHGMPSSVILTGDRASEAQLSALCRSGRSVGPSLHCALPLQARTLHSLCLVQLLTQARAATCLSPAGKRWCESLGRCARCCRDTWECDDDPPCCESGCRAPVPP